ncbi:response regulator transcription factor [Jonesia quinghaiensis]|uniref:response regulator transcription factor n=1 Tax=Jonesia quinghaiensis TaxID=262806 RepID=UPI000422D0D1|nr:response regulator [Jonesia quinghaiensis]
MAKVLVVEDDPDVAGLIEHRLRAAGHEVTMESDGESGLATALATTPDLLILDWMMPRLSGLEVCVAVRANPQMDNTKILMLTAKAQESDIERALTAGANDYVSKPFSPRELAARVEALTS